MNEEMLDLARRAVACPRWRWMDGMVCVRAEDGRRWRPWTPRVWDAGTYLPDLTDAATLGCLLALVQEAWHNPSMLWDGYAEVQRDSATLFFVMQFQHDADGFLQEIHRGTGRTMAEALVAALEAAP